MSYITNELSERIGRIDDNGYIFDNMGDCFAQITDSGYITAVAGWDTYGKIDEDGTIHDASMDVIGRIQADGYIYIHSRRVGKVSSAFVEKITPYAWNAGQPSSYNGRYTSVSDDNDSSSDAVDFLFSPFFLKLIAGVALGIYAMVEGNGGLEMLVAGPVCVFVLTFLFKIFAFNKKWFAVIMDIPRKNLGLTGEDEISVMNLKCDTRLIGVFREEAGIFPGWHMNKAHWLSVALDGSVEDEKIKFLVDMSYELTKK